MKKVNWYIVGGVGIVALLILLGGTMMSGWGNGGWGFHGYGMMGRGGMMGTWGYSPLGWFGMAGGMLLMWLLPISVLSLIVYGIVSLARNAVGPTSTIPCPTCGKGLQIDWQNCPHCGTTLK